MAVVEGLEGRVAGRPVREEFVENVLEEELVGLEELDEFEEPPKGDGKARLVRASRGYHGGLLISRGSGPSSGSIAGAPVLGFPCVIGLSVIESVPPGVHNTTGAVKEQASRDTILHEGVVNGQKLATFVEEQMTPVSVPRPPKPP